MSIAQTPLFQEKINYVLYFETIMENLKEDSFYVGLGNRIAHFRKEQNLTQQELSKKLGIKQSILAYYEKGKRKTSISLLLQIAKILYVDIEDLLDIPKKIKSKPGPIPKIQKRLEAIQELPLGKQKIVLELLDSFIHNKDKAF
jgi:transcriptional regulator with XRE-family HTH domain